MKLINKISLNFLLSAFVVFVLISAAIYVTIESAVSSEADEQLINTYHKVSGQLKKGEKISSPPFVELQPNINKKLKLGFSNVLINADTEGEGEPFREYSSLVKVDGKEYVLFVRSSIIEKEELLYSILEITGAAFLIFLAVILIVNKIISQRVFRDFYKTINRLENFSIADNKPLTFDKTDITEFKKLNTAVEMLSVKAVNEYKSLKEFTEEINHEIQTPAAVVKSKLEILLQSENLKEDEMNRLAVALNNLNKLERINKSILLLNKLEHRNLFGNSEVNLNKEIETVLDSFSDFIMSKNIFVETSLNENIVVIANSSLINILINNLISNAIKHNIKNGKLIIELNNAVLSIKNNGAKPKSNPEKFFDRFYKESDSVDSVGLGLTIVKKICELYGLKILNEFKDGIYSINLFLNEIVIIN